MLHRIAKALSWIGDVIILLMLLPHFLLSKLPKPRGKPLQDLWMKRQGAKMGDDGKWVIMSEEDA